MARTLEQIVSELNSTYQPQVKSLQQQAGLIPEQIKTQEAALGAKQEQAFGDILGGARRRGLGFSGIPLGEQAKYTSTEYLPALANLRTAGVQQATSLQDAINQIYERRDTLAQQLRQQELDRAESARQADLARRAQAAASAQPSLASLLGGQGGTAAPRVVEKAPGSFAFYDQSNKPITAGQYARATGQNIGDILYEMAQKGDRSAASWYKILQAEARNDDNGAGYKNAITQAIQRAPHIFGGLY